tara:strand:- start:97 stop:456 length:360 start_codon:yes stop_codon:yes gene_type:complete
LNYFKKNSVQKLNILIIKKNKLSNDLIKNPNYINLIKYTQDAETVIYCSIREIDEFIDAIKDTETDIYTYLDNFIYDDTKHKTVNDYILKDFKKVEKFALYLLKGYFLHNFEEYLNKLQ